MLRRQVSSTLILTREDLPDPTLPVTHRSSPALTLKSILRSVKDSLLPPSEHHL